MRTLHPRRRRFAVGVAGLGVAALALTACTTTAEPGDDNTDGETPTGGTITIAEVNELSGFNVATPTGNVDINAQIAYFTQAGFFYLDTQPEVVYDESFGTVEVVSEDPLTVTYTINEGVVWSDGTPIDADDMILSWAAASGYYDDAVYDDAGEVTAGNVYFTPAGSTEGINLTSFPEVGEDGRSITLTYSEPFADWNLFQPTGVPAHVVAENAGLDPEGLVEFFQGLPEGDEANPQEANPELRALADFWNTGFDFASLPSDPSLYLASGPYIVSEWDAGQSVTLVRNESYTGDLVPAFDQVVVRFIADATAQVQALQNGEVDIINPQASADTLASLEAIGSATVLTGPTGSYDHIDLNFGSEVFADPAVREAFLKTIPREQIVEALIRPLDPEAEVLNSQTLFIGVPGYDEAIANNGSADFAEVDIEGARELLAGATPTVRIAYNNANPNRVDAFLAIQASAQEAGFIIEDGGLGADVWGAALGQPDTWDAFIFGWSTVGVGVVGNPQLFGTNGGGNFGGYSNPEVDAIWDELVVTSDPDAQLELILEAENLIWADHFGLPLFILPGVIAHSANVEGVEYNAWQTGPIWNFWEWTPAA